MVSPCPAAPSQASARRRGRAMAAGLLLAVMLGGCSLVQFGDHNEPPPWRRPGPALLDPPERLPVSPYWFRAEAGPATGKRWGLPGADSAA
jgi:hypothetical protein